MYEKRHIIYPYEREKGRTFEPKPPPPPEDGHGHWRLFDIRSLEPGWLMCSWELSDDPTVQEDLRNARATIEAVYRMLRQLHPAESDHQSCCEVDGVIARTLVKLGTMRRRDVPQHLAKYVEDMEIEP